MPYLRISCPPVEGSRRSAIAATLTDAVVDLFTPPRGPSATETRAHTTVQFVEYGVDEMFTGGHPTDASSPDITVELSDWYMSAAQCRRVAARLTPLLVDAFGSDPDSTNIRFHSYPPTAFAVGGRVLSDRIPRIGRFTKRVSR